MSRRAASFDDERGLIRIAAAVLIAGALAALGRPVIETVLGRWDLGQSANPYWLPAEALWLYIAAPLTSLAAAVFLIGPGLILAAVFGREKNLATWLFAALAGSIGVHLLATGAFQYSTGVVAKGAVYLWLVLGFNLVTLALAALRIRQGHGLRLALKGQGADLGFALLLFWLCLVLFAPKFYWENFTGDGSGSLQFARLHIDRIWPFWPADAGPIRAAPGLTMVLFVFPESWFVRLWGEWEFAVRAPLLLYLALLYPVITQLIHTGRGAALQIADHLVITGALLLYVLANVYSGGYHAYFGDSPMPAARETLTLVVFLAYILFFAEDRRLLMLTAGIMAYLVIPTGGLWLLAWPAAVVLVWRPVPWPRVAFAVAVLVAAGIVAVLAPRLIAAFGLPFPGAEFGADNVVTRLRFVTFEDFTRFGMWAVPLGILPALFLLTWRWQDALSRALTLMALGYFLFFYVQAYRVLLHHFIPAMLPPLIVMLRSPLWDRHRGALVPLSAACLALSTWISWPREMKMHDFERIIGQHVVTEGPLFDSARRGDGDRFRGFEPRALAIAHHLLGNLFKGGYGNDDPGRHFFGAPLVWWFYSEFPKPEGQAINYIIKPVAYAGPGEGTLFEQSDGYGLYIRDRALYEAHAATALPVDTGAAIYVTPRPVLYGHGAQTGERRVYDLVPPIKRLLGMQGK